MTTHLYNFVKAQAQLAAQAARRAEALRVAQADGGIFAGPADRTKTEAMLEAGRPAAAAAASRAVAPSTKRPRSVERVDGDSDEIDREDSPAKRTRRPFRQCPGNVNDADWSAQLVRLVAYKVAHGDCNVPRRWPEDPQLATWLNNQRAGKRTLDHGQPSNAEGLHRMTVERAAALTALGLAWEHQQTQWEAMLARLTVYQVAHGDCNVPRSWPEDPQLATWVRNQKKRKKGMPEERAAKLRSLGFF